jgi:hypothetical protein
MAKCRWTVWVLTIVLASMPAVDSAAETPAGNTIQLGRDVVVLPSGMLQREGQLRRSYDPDHPAVLLVAEPHFMVREQERTLVAIASLLKANPRILDDVIFLGESIKAGTQVPVNRLAQIEPKPTADDVRLLLHTFLIPGHVAASWEFGARIPVIGMDDPALFNQSKRVWVEGNDERDNWTSFVCRNRVMAENIAEAARTHKYVIAFAGNAHFFGEHIKPTSFGIKLSSIQRYEAQLRHRDTGSTEQVGTIKGCRVGFVSDFLKERGIGYTYFSTLGTLPEIPQDDLANVAAYRELMRAQLNGTTTSYVQRHLSGWTRGVTVSPDVDAAASVLKTVIANRQVVADRAIDPAPNGPSAPTNLGHHPGEGPPPIAPAGPPPPRRGKPSSTKDPCEEIPELCKLDDPHHDTPENRCQDNEAECDEPPPPKIAVRRMDQPPAVDRFRDAISKLNLRGRNLKSGRNAISDANSNLTESRDTEGRHEWSDEAGRVRVRYDPEGAHSVAHWDKYAPDGTRIDNSGRPGEEQIPAR